MTDQITPAAEAKSSDDQIRLRARELWEERGRPEGYEDQFWEQAERDLKSKGVLGGASTQGGAPRSGGGSDGPR